MLGGPLDRRVHRAADDQPRERARRPRRATPGDAGEQVRRHRRGEADRHAVRRVALELADRCTASSRPLRTIATAVGDVLELREHVRGEEDGERRPRASSRSSSWKTCWRIGSRPLVGSSRTTSSGRCAKAWTIPTFCLLPFESSRIGRSSGRSKRLASASRRRTSRCRAGARRSVASSGRSVARRGAARRADSRAALAPRCPAGRTSSPSTSARPEVGRSRSSSRRISGGLARAVGSDEAEDLAVLDLEVEVRQRDHAAAVGLRQPLGPDRRPRHDRATVAHVYPGGPWTPRRTSPARHPRRTGCGCRRSVAAHERTLMAWPCRARALGRSARGGGAPSTPASRTPSPPSSR